MYSEKTNLSVSPKLKVTSARPIKPLFLPKTTPCNVHYGKEEEGLII